MNRIQIRANEFLSLVVVVAVSHAIQHTKHAHSKKALNRAHVFRVEPVSTTTTLFAEVSSWLFKGLGVGVRGLYGD